MFEQNIERGSQGHSQRGEMDECPHVMDWRKKLAPELQTDDCFATGVTLCYGIALVKPKESVTISTLIFRKAPILGRSYGDPTPPPLGADHFFTLETFLFDVNRVLSFCHVYTFLVANITRY